MNAQRLLPAAVAAALIAMPHITRADIQAIPRVAPANISTASSPATLDAAAKAKGDAKVAVVDRQALKTDAVAKAGGNASVVAVERQVAKLDAAAKLKADAKVSGRIAPDFIRLAGSQDKAQSLVAGCTEARK